MALIHARRRHRHWHAVLLRSENDADSEQDDTQTKDDDLPELVINESDPTATAKELAALIAKTDNFLFNGYGPIKIAAEANGIPRALEATTEAIRVVAHEVACLPLVCLV